MLHGALLKNEQDVHLFEQLVFLNRRARTLTAGAAMLVRFFTDLRAGGVPVTLPEFLSLLEALRRGSPRCRAEEFYYLARMAMVKDERHFDRFDRVFAEHFAGRREAVREAASPSCRRNGCSSSPSGC